MICPFCDTKMRASNREGIEIQYCPQCGGIRLQRGALEGIVARVSRNPTQEQSRTKDAERENHDDDGNGENHSRSRNGRQGQPREPERRRGGVREFLGNLFDFG
jgi:Zn-finger nucleic acid-binding protein